MKNLWIFALILSIFAWLWVGYNFYQISTIKNLPTIQKDIQTAQPFDVVFVSDDEKFDEKVKKVKENIFKSMNYRIVKSDSEEWKKLIKEFDAKYLPLMITWKQIENSEIKDYLSQLATKKWDKYSVNIADIASQMRVDINKEYLKVPEITKNMPVAWPENAKVTMIEVSDFQCPFCWRFHNNAYKKIMEQYWDKIKRVFLNLPLSFHEKAQKAAEAWLCANKQWKFWEMHDKIFENQDKMSVENYKKWAKELWLNEEEFSKCLDSWEMEEEVKNQAKVANSFWIQWTPWIFINHKFVNWAYPFDTFKKMIDEELSK